MPIILWSLNFHIYCVLCKLIGCRRLGSSSECVLSNRSGIFCVCSKQNSCQYDRESRTDRRQRGDLSNPKIMDDHRRPRQARQFQYNPRVREEASKQQFQPQHAQIEQGESSESANLVCYSFRKPCHYANQCSEKERGKAPTFNTITKLQPSIQSLLRYNTLAHRVTQSSPSGSADHAH